MTNKSKKKLVAMRLNAQVRELLKKMSQRTGKGKTRLVEEAVLLHSKTISL